MQCWVRKMETQPMRKKEPMRQAIMIAIVGVTFILELKIRFGRGCGGGGESVCAVAHGG